MKPRFASSLIALASIALVTSAMSAHAQEDIGAGPGKSTGGTKPSSIFPVAKWEGSSTSTIAKTTSYKMPMDETNFQKIQAKK